MSSAVFFLTLTLTLTLSRWDSLGEYLALGASLEDLGEKTGDDKVRRLGLTLTEA